MPLLLRLRAILALTLLLAALSSVARADKLNGFYSGSGGLTQEVHRVLLIEFAADGTAILQQKWHDKDAQTWHAHWKRNKKTVTITYDAATEKPLPEPLIFTFKHGTLTATSWDAPTLGVLGPPKLAPFGGKTPQVTSVGSCQALNTTDPTKNCITWDSRR